MLTFKLMRYHNQVFLFHIFQDIFILPVNRFCYELQSKCWMNFPPGDEIFRQDDISLFEVNFFNPVIAV